jgi:hypothetical protein
VRVLDALCPFCGDALPASLRASAPRPAPLGRLGRSALLAFGVVAGADVLAACSDRSPPPSPAPYVDPNGSPVPLYGAPPGPPPSPPPVLAPPPRTRLVPLPPPPVPTEPPSAPPRDVTRPTRMQDPPAPAPSMDDPGTQVQAYGAPAPDGLDL